MMRTTQSVLSRRKRQSGFTLLEAVLAAAVLMVGMLSLLAVFSSALAATHTSQQDQIARQKAKEGLESIFTARTTGQITFDKIKNVANGGIFMSGFQTLLGAGPDGLVGTADDVAVAGCPSGVECVFLPGPDGILGNSDDTTLSLANYQRDIAISDVLRPDGTIDPNLRQVTVTVRYSGTQQRNYTVTALISSFR